MIKAPKGVKALFSDVNKVGKRIKASKKKFTWKFSVDNREHTVDMYVSSLSGKRKVLLDGDLLYSGKAQNGVYFHYPMKVDRLMVAIEQMEDTWDLKISGVSFSQLAVMRQSAPESAGAEWTGAQEWKGDKETEFGQLHNKWDDWDKPKPKPKEEVWEERPLPRAAAEDWQEDEERDTAYGRKRPEQWEERETRVKPPARPAADDYAWDTKGFPQEEDDYPPRYERRDERPPRREPPRDRRDDDRYRREEEYRPRPREEDYRSRPREDEYRPRPREDDRRRRDEDRYREEEERYREERYPPRRLSPGREEDDYDFRSRPAEPARKPPPREEPRQPEFDPFGINANPTPPTRSYQEDDEGLYPSLSSLEAKRQTQQTAFAPYQPPAPVSDPFAAPVDFTSTPANVFESEPQVPQVPAEFRVTSSRPFDEDPFGSGPVMQPPPKKHDHDLVSLVDLDGLSLGDNYSPAALRKHEEQNKAVSIGATTPNVPMNQLKTNPPPQPGAPNPMMTAPMMGNPMMPNPMAAAMMMQSYMTGMMMNSMMMNQGGVPQQRYF